MKTALLCVAFAMLSGCATMGYVSPAQQAANAKRIEAIIALKIGSSTLADVEAAYSSEHCLDFDHASQSAQIDNDVAAQNCSVMGLGSTPPITTLIYVEHSSWSPSCWSDPDGCQDLTQETTLTTTYTFGDSGTLESESTKSECTAYVNEYVFDNGCIDHD